MKQADIHPCFSCKLPDCDDGSPRCALRRASNEYSRLNKAGEPVSNELRTKANIAWNELYSHTRYREKAERGGRS
ncbi:hypothetical protein [uncultured Roseibium sp.]|uniref:hypothetical protein n=1 Tax=uncultured Roseibium sp. TaxID=1936171 RepID=UPI00321758FB